MVCVHAVAVTASTFRAHPTVLGVPIARTEQHRALKCGLVGVPADGNFTVGTAAVCHRRDILSVRDIACARVEAVRQRILGSILLVDLRAHR